MSRIPELKRDDEEEAGHGINPQTNQQINSVIDKLAGKYKDAEDLWERVGDNFLPGLDRLAKENQTDQKTLIQILARAAREPKPQAASKAERLGYKLRRHSLEVLGVLIIIAIFSLLLVRALSRHDTVVVNSTLPAFHVIEENDVVVEKRLKMSGSFTSKDEVIGRYLVQQVSPGVGLSASQVSAAKLPESDRVELPRSQILFLTVKAGAVRQNLTPPAHVRLLLSPRERAVATSDPAAIENMSVDDAIVLALNRQGESASLAIGLRTPQDVAKVTSLLGTSDVFVSEPVKK